MADGVSFPSPIIITGAVEDQNFTLAAPGVLAYATAPPGFDLAVLNYSQPASGCGTVAIAPDGGLSLAPAKDFWGNCTFGFAVLDNTGALVEATVVVVFGELGAPFRWKC